MATPTALPQWQTKQALIGDRYNLGYLALDATVIPSATVAEFRRVLSYRNVAVESVTVLGRVLSVNVRTLRSGSLLSLLGEYVQAGGATTADSTQFRLSSVSQLEAGSGGNTSLPNPAYDLGRDLGEATNRLLYELAHIFSPRNVGEEVGAGLGSVFKPLIIPAILVVAGIYFAGKVFHD